MMKIENIVSSSTFNKCECTLKILAHEQNGKYLYLQSYIQIPRTRICIHDRLTKAVRVLYTSSDKLNVIQASVNSNGRILAFVTKDKQNNMYSENEKNRPQMSSLQKHVYNLTMIDVKRNRILQNLHVSSEKQIMVQFLYSKKPTALDRLLVFEHLKYILLYELKTHDEQAKIEIHKTETVTNSFSWAQWDTTHQCLFYIYNRESVCQEDDKPAERVVIPTLSAFQFHDNMPHETVLNIPLNIPNVKRETTNYEPNVYDDIPVPLRVHDCSLNILVLMRSTGLVYICHHYFYQPVSETADVNVTSVNSSHTVHFAYSVTVLHHGSILYCSVPDINWSKAIDMKPVFCMFGDQHLLVYISDLFTHILDIGTGHEPCCHFVVPSPSSTVPLSYLVPIPDSISEILDLRTLDIYKATVSRRQLMTSFNSDQTSTHNRLSILHYILVHLNDMEMIKEIISSLGKNVTNIYNVKLLKEFLVGGCYALTSRQVSSDVVDLLHLLPLTTTHTGTLTDERINDYSFSLEQEMLCNPSVMLLTPRQRLIPFRSDVWTRLWNHLPNHILTNSQTSRFKNSTVVEKLAVSLVCYQPEALSRCCTPLSPGAPHIASTGMLADVTNIYRLSKSGINPLPFQEVEASAASKQEHIISVNLREISLHLVKLGKSPIQVHAVAMRYASSQLEISRILCSYLTQAAGIDTRNTERGFYLIDRLPRDRKRILFGLMERYYVATDTTAFPLPQGFPSFFAYLGYRTFSIENFINYVRINVFQVNIDVVKAIMAELSDHGEGFQNKLNLLLQLPKSRVRRILNQWHHPVSLMVRAREHSVNILSGISTVPPRASVSPKRIRHGAGLTAFPSNERLSPLDTFLDLLTAKANLNDIDFTLLTNATITSTDDFLND